MNGASDEINDDLDKKLMILREGLRSIRIDWINGRIVYKNGKLSIKLKICIDNMRSRIVIIDSYLKFSIIFPKYLIENVEEGSLIEINALYRYYVRETWKYYLSKQAYHKALIHNPTSESRLLINSLNVATTRIEHAENFVKTKKVLVVVGINRYGKISIEKYDFEKQRWFQAHGSSSKPMRLQSVLLNTGEKVYMIGGLGNDSRKVDVFDVKLGTWSICSDMLKGRSLPGAVIFNDLIYVSGGRGDEGWLKSCEKLDPKMARWCEIANMNEKRWDHGMCVMNGKIYVVGGRNGRNSLSSVEFYSPGTNSWSTFPNMSVGRSGLGVTANDGKLYVVGGSGGYGEVFDTVSQNWNRLSDMSIAPRYNPGVVVAANQLIFIIGGYNFINGKLNSVEVYDPRMATWTMLANNLIESKNMVSAAVTDLSI